MKKNLKEKYGILLKKKNEKYNALENENNRLRKEVLDLNKKISEFDNSIRQINTKIISLNKDNNNYTN